jgi:hypothetical protein
MCCQRIPSWLEAAEGIFFVQAPRFRSLLALEAKSETNSGVVQTEVIAGLCYSPIVALPYTLQRSLRIVAYPLQRPNFTRKTDAGLRAEAEQPSPRHL